MVEACRIRQGPAHFTRPPVACRFAPIVRVPSYPPEWGRSTFSPVSGRNAREVQQAMARILPVILLAVFTVAQGLALASGPRPAHTARAMCDRQGSASRATRMCAAPRPLSMLKDLTGGQNAATRASSSTDQQGDEPSSKYCKYDSIREMTRASRERSYAQGRNGCCSKAASYLETTTSKPVDKGRWGRNA